ncbi:hypothetical protein [Rhodococcoides fascians]|uniref:hypothetical protein n=1 Tax=Rhodococcoides fascians TaxID=1828 RepID=UPI000522FE12|nr:hypothetical protein [Rhodococcus fascians]
MGIAPDKPRPDTAYVGTTGQAGVANVQYETEAKIKGTARGPVDQAYSDGRNSLTNNMFGGFGNGIGGLVAMLVQGAFGIVGGVADLIGGLLGVRNKADNAQQQANQAIENTSQVVQQVRAVMNQITAPFTESWLTQVPGQQVSFPDALLQTHPKRAGRPAPVAAPWIGEETIRTATSDGGNNWFTTFATAYTPAKNLLVAAYIQSNYAEGRSTVTFKTGAVSSPCALHVVVARMLPSGDAEVAWVSANLTPTMPSGKVEWSVAAPTDIPFDELEHMVVGVHQIGEGNVRPLAAIERDQYARSAESFPPQQAMNFVFSSAITTGSIIPKSGQIFSTPFLLWIGIGQRLYSGDPLPRSFFDNFGGTDLNWTKVGGGAATITGGMFAYSGSNDRRAFYYYPQPLAYADQRVEAYCSAPNGVDQGMMLRGNAAGSSFFALSLTNNSAALRQWTSASESGYTALGSYSGSTGDTYWALEAIGDVLTAYQRVDGEWIPRIQFVGAGLLGGRYSGLYTNRAFFANSGRWDNYQARDMVELQEEAA